MKDLPPLLAAIPNLRHAMYADDLTLWVPTGCTGAQKDALQEAIHVTQTYLQARALECAPEKSAILTLYARTYKKRKDPIPDPELTINNQAVPTVSHLRILCLSISKNGSGSQTLPILQRTLTELTQIGRRIAYRRNGLQENDTLKITQVILISRINYGTSYLALKSAEKEKLNTFIRQAYKLALGLPPSTYTRKLLQLGMHNTTE